MIVEALLKGLIYIIKSIFILVKSLVPVVSVPVQFAYVLAIIIGTTTQANNFIYFILGDTAFILIPSIIMLLTYKYIVYPIIKFIISFVAHPSS